MIVVRYFIYTDEANQLALAIEQAAQLIKDDAIGGPSIASTYELFKDHLKSLPARPAGKRSDTVHALDSVRFILLFITPVTLIVIFERIH